MPMVLVKLAILVLISLVRVGLDFPRPFHKLFIFYLHEHLSYRSIERRQNQIRSARWTAGASIIVPPSSLSIWPLALQLVLVISSLGIRLLSLVFISSLPQPILLLQCICQFYSRVPTGYPKYFWRRNQIVVLCEVLQSSPWWPLYH